MRKKKLLAVICATLMVVSGICVPDFRSTAVYAEETTSEFVIEDGVLTKYNGSGGDVKIPEGVTSIGDYAFSWCSGLTSICIPSSVTSIGRYAFRGCSGITSITVDENNNKYDSRENCNAIIEKENNELILGCVSTKIPRSVTSIGENAFSGCSGLTNIDIPEGVTSIGEGAFDGCSSLTSIKIPSSVTKIGIHPNIWTTGSDHTFRGCSSLISIIVDEKNEYYDSRNDCNAIIKKYNNELIKGCVNTIIPNTVNSIGNSAFYDCSDLTSINIPEGVTSIGNDAFYNCSGLTSISIPNSVTSIGRYAFSGCRGLTSITVDEDNEYYDSRENCNAIIDKKEDKLILGCSNTKIPNTVKIIGGLAFYGCSGLTSINIPEGVTSIYLGAFEGCSNLESIIISSSVTSIGEHSDGIASDSDITFLDCSSSLIIKGYSGSAAETYAKENGIDFKVIGSEEQDSSSKKGDADGNNKVDLNDAKLVLKLALGIGVNVSEQGKANADYDKNGKVDLNDAKYVLKEALGIKVTLSN